MVFFGFHIALNDRFEVEKFYQFMLIFLCLPIYGLFNTINRFI